MNHKLDTEVHTVWFWLYEVLEQEKLNYGDRNQNSGCWWGLTRKRHEEFSEVMKMVYFLIGVQFTWVYISVRLTARLRSISLYVNYTLIKDCNPKKKTKTPNNNRDGALPVLSFQPKVTSILNITCLCPLIFLLHVHMSLSKIYCYFACLWTLYISQHIYTYMCVWTNYVFL